MYSSLRFLPAKSARRVVWLLLLSSLTVLAQAQTMYITPTGAGTRSGFSWANALSGTALQGALASAPSGTTVLVATGLYKPTSTTAQTISFSIPSGVEVYGGYTANTNTRTTDPSSTTLSGDIDDDNTLAGNTYHVVTTSSGNTVLDGLVITQGDARSSTDTRGGGMLAQNGSPTIRAVMFVNNAAENGGGSFLASVTSATLTNCLFINNTCTKNGGGLVVSQTGARPVSISNCRFVTNNTKRFGTGSGGGIYTDSSNPVFANCTFTGNTGEVNGGGMFLGGGSPSLTNCSFADNQAQGNGGGAICNYGSSLTLTNCSFVHNVASSGGAIYNSGGSPSLTNCGFVRNNASGGGAIYNVYSSPSLTNCSFVNNSAPYGGGAINNATSDSNPRLTNCIIWGNSSGIANSNNSTYQFTDSQDEVLPGPGNRSVDPLFVDAASDNPQLSVCSPLIDAGDNTVSVPNQDLAGNPRRQRTIDLGAYEFQGALATPVAITRQPVSGSSVCVGTAVTASISTSGMVTSYQWYRNGGMVSGQTSATLSLSNTTTAQSGSYSVVVTGACNSLTSTAFSLTVNALPTVSISPSATAVCAGQSAIFTATPGLATYRWTTPNNGVVLTTASISGSVAGTYSLTVTNASGCTATAQASLTVNALPTVSISPSATAVCAGQSATFTATPGLAAYRWMTPNSGPTLTTASISGSVEGTYSLTVTNASGCTATASASLTVNPLPTPAIVGLVSSICQEAVPVTLTGNPAGGMFTIDGTPATTLNPASLSVGQHTVVYSFTNTSGCYATASQTVTIKPTPPAPLLATQSGHSYPAGVSSLTASQNTGNVILTASGCAGGTITWSGGNSTTLAVSTMNTGVQTFSATCQTNGCTSPIATATVTVVGTTLSVLHRDGNGQLNTNTLAPYLQLNNQGTTAIPYSEITVRYWLTVENYAPLLFSINYAQLGSDKVHLQYVPATTGSPTATGYIEFSFDGSTGSLAAGQNSGAIQDIINKQDYSYFDQSNDYSYANPGNFAPNPRITAYRNGVLFYGMEPGPVVPTLSVKAQTQNNTGADANTIEAVLSVTNDGNQPINYGDLKVRYYFTQDNTQPLVLSQVGYTALGSGNVTAQLVRINPALAGADQYLEVSFSSSLGQLAPGASTGGVTYQIRHADYSGFNQANDYSYQGTGGTMLNPHVVVLVGGQRVYGTEPGAGARLGAEESEVPLSVRVLGNPVTGSALELEVTGAEGQPLRLQLSDSNGRVIGERSLERAGTVERQSLPVGGQPAGLLLLRVSSPSQSQTVKVLKVD